MEIKDVENLAELAKIDLNEEEKKQILKDMEGILNYVKQIESVKLEDIEAEYSALFLREGRRRPGGGMVYASR